MLSNVNPKLTVGALAGIFAASILTNLSFINPDMLHILGPWAPFTTGTISSVLGFIAGYWKADTRAATPPPEPDPGKTLTDLPPSLNLPASHLDAAGPGNLPVTFPAAAVQTTLDATTPAPEPAGYTLTV